MRKTNLMSQLTAGARLRVTIRSGCLGCADAQDACEGFGYLILYKRGDQYRIDDPEDENIVCVDNPYYIESIIETAEPLA